MPFILAVMLAAWIGGLKSGLFAIVFSALMLESGFGEGIGFEFFSMSRQMRLVLFAAIGGLASWSIATLHASRQRLEERQRELEKEVIERRRAETSEREQRELLAAEMLRREQAEIGLQEREERLRLAVESADVGTWDFNLLTGEREWSSRAKVMFGLSADADVSKVVFRDRVHPDDLERVNQAAQKAFDPSGGGNYEIDCRLVWPDSTIHWFIAKGQVFFEGEGSNRRASRLIGVVLDITERKHATELLEAEQELLRHTIEEQDQERQLIAYEIHDGLMQYLTGALMQLQSVRLHVNPTSAIETIESIEGIMQQAVAEGRRIMNGIRTPVLDDHGVVAAVQQLIDEEERAHVQVEFVKDEGLKRMEPKIEEAIYRITQEALTNAHKHSQSKNVRVELGLRGDRVHLEVRDWGVGITPSNKSKGIHGVRGMTERARIVGGLCKIESTPGEGTRVVVDLPYLSRN